MMYDSRDMEHDRHNFFLFWTIFCLFTPLTAKKMKTSKKKKKKKKNLKKCLEISSPHTSVPKIMIICSTVPEIWCVTDIIVFFSFWAIFCPFTPITAQKMKISKKMEKPSGDTIILHNSPKNHDHMLYCSLYMVHDRCNCYFSF